MGGEEFVKGAVVIEELVVEGEAGGRAAVESGGAPLGGCKGG